LPLPAAPRNPARGERATNKFAGLEMLGYGRGASAFEQKERPPLCLPASQGCIESSPERYLWRDARSTPFFEKAKILLRLPTLFSFSEGRKKEKDISSVLKLLSLLIFELYLNIHLIQNIYSSM
jgi:hypothetical protein